MARLRNITDRELLVAPTGAIVGPDGLLDVPDDVYRRYVWPDTIWAEVDVPEPAPEPGQFESATVDEED